MTAKSPLIPLICMICASFSLLCISCGCAWRSQKISTMGLSMNNVRDFGAVGDGKHNDTASIQRALDAGGMVHLPDGVYRCGTLYLRSNGGLHLSDNARIVASHDIADYNALEYCSQNEDCPEEFVSGHHLISAVEVENILIEGGTIDGDGRFWTLGPWGNHPVLKPNPERPAQMVFIVESKNVTLRNVKLTNASYWHCLLLGCENVDVTGLAVLADPQIINSDGLDIDSCRQVRVSDCDIRSGDDALTLRASAYLLKEQRPCEDVVVKNCRLSSEYATGIRIGVGNGLIRNCELENLEITHCKTGFSLIGKWGDTADSCGASISDVRISNVRLWCMRPFAIGLDHRYNAPISNPAKCVFENVRFEKIHGRAELSNHIEGNGVGMIRDFLFKDIELKYEGVGKAPFRDGKGQWSVDSDDVMFAIDNAINIRFENVVLHSNGQWKAELRKSSSSTVWWDNPNWIIDNVDQYVPFLGF